MGKNNGLRAAILGALMGLGPAAHAGVELTDARAVLVAGEPRQVEIYFVLRNATAHELELMKVQSPRADRVTLKLRSTDAENRRHVWPMGKLEVPKGGLFRAAHDGPFLLVTGLDPALRVGDRLTVELTFEEEPPVVLTATVEAD
jgi:copper(I)-binding protein